MTKGVLMCILAIGMFCSCESIEAEKEELIINQVEPGETLLDAELLEALNGSKWVATSCPSERVVNFNGYSECDYFMSLEFVGSKLFIKHNSDAAATPHNLCSSEGTLFPVSIQACTNTTWSPWFYINITDVSATTLKFTVQDLDFYQDYFGDFTFRRN